MPSEDSTPLTQLCEPTEDSARSKPTAGTNGAESAIARAMPVTNAAAASMPSLSRRAHTYEGRARASASVSRPCPERGVFGP
eukprot:scaffold200691_cov33-Tisochrysis_lutea.AAC.5